MRVISQTKCGKYHEADVNGECLTNRKDTYKRRKSYEPAGCDERLALQIGEIHKQRKFYEPARYINGEIRTNQAFKTKRRIPIAGIGAVQTSTEVSMPTEYRAIPRGGVRATDGCGGHSRKDTSRFANRYGSPTVR